MLLQDALDVMPSLKNHPVDPSVVVGHPELDYGRCAVAPEYRSQGFALKKVDDQMEVGGLLVVCGLGESSRRIWKRGAEVIEGRLNGLMWGDVRNQCSCS